jgi:hypothetical protein
VRPTTRRTPTPANPDPLHQQWRAQPPPIDTLANEAPQATRTSLWQEGPPAGRRHITRLRRWIRPYDGHWGRFTTLSSEPSWLLYDRDGSLSGSADAYCALLRRIGQATVTLSPITVDGKAAPSPTPSPNQHRQNHTPGFNPNPPPTGLSSSTVSSGDRARASFGRSYAGPRRIGNVFEPIPQGPLAVPSAPPKRSDRLVVQGPRSLLTRRFHF